MSSPLSHTQRFPTDRAYFIAKELLTTERTYLKDLEVVSVVRHTHTHTHTRTRTDVDTHTWCVSMVRHMRTQWWFNNESHPGRDPLHR